MKADDLRDDSAIAVLSTHGLDRRAGESLRRFLAAGGGVFVAAAPDADAAVLSVLFYWTPPLDPEDVEHAGVLAATDLRHPVLRPFAAVAANFGQIAFDHAWRIDTREHWRVVARFTNGDAALVERTGGPGRLLLFTSDVDRRWNNFPLHASFVPFAQETARYLARARRPLRLTRGGCTPGRRAATRPRRAWNGRAVAVNVDPRESRIERVTADEFRAMVTPTTSPVRPRRPASPPNRAPAELLALRADDDAGGAGREAFVGSR